MSEIKVSGLCHVYSADTPFEKIAIDNVNVEIKSTSLFGGVTNKVENKENQPTIKIRAFCLFGGVEVK